MNSANDHNSQLLWNTCWEPVTKCFICVSSFYELGSEISPRKELGSEKPRLYNQKVAESTFKSRPALTPRSLQSLPTTTISISFHKYHCYLRFPSTWYLSIMCVLSHFSRVWLFATPWTAAHQVPLSMGFSRQEYWSGLPRSPPGDLPNPGIKAVSLVPPALAGGFFTTSATWEAHWG